MIRFSAGGDTFGDAAWSIFAFMEARKNISDFIFDQPQKPASGGQQYSSGVYGWHRFLFRTGLPFLGGLFLWKGISGLWDYTEVELSFQRQRVFGDWAPYLAKTNIALQLTAGVLLALGVPFRRLRAYALGLSVGILAGYTAYTQLVLLNAFGFSICSCIGWFAGMSWTGIFIMNAILLVLVLTLFFITLKERRPP